MLFHIAECLTILEDTEEVVDFQRIGADRLKLGPFPLRRFKPKKETRIRKTVEGETNHVLLISYRGLQA